MDNEIIKSESNSEDIYTSIRSFVITAQNKVYAAVNTAMVIAYWEIGEQIYKACGENDRAEYGKNLLKYLSDKLTAEFGKGFTERNLRAMRQFYSCFPNRHTLCAECGVSIQDTVCLKLKSACYAKGHPRYCQGDALSRLSCKHP